jgi:Rieske [2Fe-2S] domain
MEKIFGRAWLMIGHESLVPGTDDFCHTYMGEDPVILTRDGEGRLHALLNMCRHRGNRVVRCDDGNLMLGIEHALRAALNGGYGSNKLAELEDDVRRFAAAGAATTLLALADHLPKLMEPLGTAIQPE